MRKFGNGTEEHTLYDSVGRVTVKIQKDYRGELLWGEGYVYGTDGKRTATVDNAGRVIFYEYNQKGQLAAVYYPYTQEMEIKLKTEAEINGLPVAAASGENRFFSSSEKADLIKLLNCMKYGLAYNLTAMQIVLKESYEYDGNGNRIAKTTPYGKIEYTYDKENCLLASGSKGQNYVNYTYDNMGNLFTEESSEKSVKYVYNAENRMIYCEVIDRSAKEYAQTNYAYDAFGRRILVQDKGEVTLRTLYDGFTFDLIKQGPAFENGLFTDSQSSGIRWSSTGQPTGDRYRYLGDDETKDENRYIYLDDNSYKTVSSRYKGERAVITANNTLAAQTTSDYGTEYFAIDLLGSVLGITDTTGTQNASYTYDACGSLVRGALTAATDFGYLGKQIDPTTSLYNYGYRDYKPQTARFTTIDPIRDGYNWFAYCNSDTINFIDLFGLNATDSKVYGQIDPKDVNGQFVYLSVSKSKATMDVYISRYTDGHQVDKFTGFQVVTNVQKTKVDNSKASDISRTQNNGTHPTQVPNGIYEIKTAIAPKIGNGKYGIGKQGLLVEVAQDLLVENTQKYIKDDGYMIHITPNFFTDGCVGFYYELNNAVSKQQAIAKQMLLVSMFEEMNSNGGKTYIEYKD